MDTSFHSTINCNIESFRNEIETHIKKSQQIVDEEFKSVELEEKPSDFGDTLGLTAFKTPNVTQHAFNILQRPPKKAMKIANFDSSAKAQIPYIYANKISNSKVRSQAEKDEIKEWLKTMPPPPPPKKPGFPKGFAEAWYASKNPDGYQLVLERIFEKMSDPRLKRPDPSEYIGDKGLLQTDKALLDRLPLVEYFTRIYNSENAGNN